LRKKEEAERRAKAEAIRIAKEEADRQAREEQRSKQPLQPGRYLFPEPRPSGTIDGLKFTLSEVDLRADAMLIHLKVENVGVDPATELHSRFQQKTRDFQFALVGADGVPESYNVMHIKEGALTKENGSVTFPTTGKRGALVMEFTRREQPRSTFSLTVNRQPLLVAINLHKARFQSF
jgi:hypothetical protein